MSINERLYQLRTHLGLSTRAFGSSLNITGGAVTNMEKGRRDVTERTIKDICREYGVNPDWLMNGNEPMFEDILKEVDVHEEVRDLSMNYFRLNDSDKILVKNLIHSLAEKSHPN